MVKKIINIQLEQKAEFINFFNNYEYNNVLTSQINRTTNDYQVILEGYAEDIENFLSELNMYLD